MKLQKWHFSDYKIDNTLGFSIMEDWAIIITSDFKAYLVNNIRKKPADFKATDTLEDGNLKWNFVLAENVIYVSLKKLDKEGIMFILFKELDGVHKLSIWSFKLKEKDMKVQQNLYFNTSS